MFRVKDRGKLGVGGVAPGRHPLQDKDPYPTPSSGEGWRRVPVRPQRYWVGGVVRREETKYVSTHGTDDRGPGLSLPARSPSPRFRSRTGVGVGLRWRRSRPEPFRGSWARTPSSFVLPRRAPLGILRHDYGSPVPLGSGTTVVGACGLSVKKDLSVFHFEGIK